MQIVKGARAKSKKPQSRPLTARMQRGARLEAAGRAPAQVAQMCGVCADTVYSWHARPDYRALVAEMVVEINERAKDKAASIRALAAEVGVSVLRAALEDLERERGDEDDKLSPSNLRDLSTVGKDWYAVASGQTGLASKVSVEISAGPDADEEADAAAALIARLRDGR